MTESLRPNPYAAPKSPDPSSEVRPPSANPAWMVWTGRVISTLPVLMLIFSAVMKFIKPPGMAEGLANIGWKEEQMLTLGILELACTILYVIPQTSVLGAILLTGYLGGATATHVRVGESWIGPVIFGVLVWLGLFLRDYRLRAILPLRSI
jgi:hypothetical protein